MNSNHKNKTIGLALGGGGARGCAHIGVIKALEESVYNAQYVAGTSIGSVIGGVYCSGHLDEFEKYLKKIKWYDVIKNIDFTFPKDGLIKCKKFIKLLSNFITEENFEDLNKKFTTVSTDLYTGEEVCINSGKILDGIRSSIAIPGVITPNRINNKTLIDGGVVNPVPISVLKNKVDVLIAVDLNYYYIKKRMHRQKKQLFSLFSERQFNIIDIIENTIMIMQKELADKKLLECKPDILIRPNLAQYGIFDFHKAKEMIQIGYKETKEILK